MSHWSILRLTLIAILGLAYVCPLSAQSAERAPMPRAKECAMVCVQGIVQTEASCPRCEAGRQPGSAPKSSLVTVHCGGGQSGTFVVRLSPVPMPRAIVEVIGTIELGFPNDSWMGASHLRPIFRPAPITRTAAQTDLLAIERSHGWHSPFALPQQVLLGLDHEGCERCCHNAQPVQVLPVCRLSSKSSSGSTDQPGGWWLEEVRVPQPAPTSVASGPAPAMKTAANQCCQDRFTTAASSSDPHAAGSTTRGTLSGTWYRDLEGAVIAATFSGDELKLCITMHVDDGIACVTLIANYAVTKEGLVHGVVIGADVDVKATTPEASAAVRTALAEGMNAMQKLVDCPFSFRVKSTSAGVMVSNLKTVFEGLSAQDLALVCGMFQPAANGKFPAPKRVKFHSAGVSRCESPACPVPVAVPPGMPPFPCPAPIGGAPVIPTGYSLPAPHMTSVPAMIPPAPPVITTSAQDPRLTSHGLPHPTAAALRLPPSVDVARGAVLQPTGYSPPRPINVPPGDFGMMSEVFGEMLGAPSASKPGPASSSGRRASPLPMGPMTLPTPPRIEKP